MKMHELLKRKVFVPGKSFQPGLISGVYPSVTPFSPLH